VIQEQKDKNPMLNLANRIDSDTDTTFVEENPVQPVRQPEPDQKPQPSALTRFTNRLLATITPTPRNRVSAAILEQMLPVAVEDTNESNVIGGILEYDGPTVMVAPDEKAGRIGLEVRTGDLIFATMSGVWIGADHYSDMPKEIEDYNFITSGTRAEYNELVESMLEAELARHNQVMEYLMAA
jgi:hypothetical protein